MVISQLMMAALAVSSSVPVPLRFAGDSADPPIKVWLSSDGEFLYGDRARVYIQAAEDGYAVVLHADTRGRVRVLFPLAPDGDHYVRGGKKYEVKSSGEHEAFVVEDTTGRGVVMAAFSSSRFLVEKYAKGGHWDFRALAPDTSESDPEAALLDIVRVMQPSQRFTYDVATYIVYGTHYPDVRRYPPYPHPRPRPWPGWPWWW
ncbi:MAG: DUF4384 domain-containing protein [Gemmatimonadetes bacterium]|nr:DUF4384 domain-containing protein [Gemmatimonadota bacterium]